MRLPILAAAALLASAGAAAAQVTTPCAALPLAGAAPSTNTVTEPSYCDAAGLAVPAWQRSGYAIPPAAGGGALAYTDRFQGECQQVLGGARTGLHKRSTICPPARQKVAVGGVWMCRSQAAATRPTTPRADCYAGHPITPSATSFTIFLPRAGASQGVRRIMVTGRNVTWADIGLTAGTPGVAVPEISAVRGVENSACMAPRCLPIVVTTTPRTTPGRHTVTLGWPTGGATAVLNLTAVDPPPLRPSRDGPPPKTCTPNVNC